MSQQLTINDPVAPEILKQFATLNDAKADLALRILALENEKIRILAAGRRVEDQLTRLFEACLVDRGISPDTNVEIDPKTGVLQVMAAQGTGPTTLEDTVPVEPK